MIKNKKIYFSESNPFHTPPYKMIALDSFYKDRKTGEASFATCGSVTVEATFALSFFLLFFAALLSVFGILQRQIKTEYTLDTAAQKAAVYAGVLDADELDINLSLLGNGISISDEDVTIGKVDVEKIAFLPESVTTFITSQKVVRRAWTGRTLEEDEDGDDEDDEYVYVAENGTVYHTRESCTHLLLSVSETTSNAVSKLRNIYGEKYYPCEKCGGGSGTIYITSDGNRYHASKDCSGLKRTYSKVKKSECDLPACSRCGKE